MVAVAVDGPLRENDVGSFGCKGARESLVMWRIDDRAAVYLAGKSGSGFKRQTSVLGFRGPNGGAAV
jgi:hypothetical protein